MARVSTDSMQTIWKMTFFVDRHILSCFLFLPPSEYLEWLRNYGCQKTSLPWKRNAKAKAIFQCTAALFTFLGRFTASTPGTNAGLCALTLTHSTSESHSPTHTIYYWLISSLSPLKFPHPGKQLVMAWFPEYLFRYRFGGRKLYFFYTYFILPFSLMMQLWTLPWPQIAEILSSLIFEYRKDIWAVFLSLWSPSQLHSPVLLWPH